MFELGICKCLLACVGAFSKLWTILCEQKCIELKNKNYDNIVFFLDIIIQIAAFAVAAL